MGPDDAGSFAELPLPPVSPLLQPTRTRQSRAARQGREGLCIIGLFFPSSGSDRGQCRAF